MYDITSSCADDFINHEEILDTLAYADQNKENSTLIDSIIQKAKKRKGAETAGEKSDHEESLCISSAETSY